MATRTTKKATKKATEPDHNRSGWDSFEPSEPSEPSEPTSYGDVFSMVAGLERFVSNANDGIRSLLAQEETIARAKSDLRIQIKAANLAIAKYGKGLKAYKAERRSLESAINRAQKDADSAKFQAIRKASAEMVKVLQKELATLDSGTCHATIDESAGVSKRTAAGNLA